MKVGLSLSKCVLDIVENKININEVLVIITRTNFNPTIDNDWNQLWYEYTGSTRWINYDFYNKEHENIFKTIVLNLYKSGKLHQPRQFGQNPTNLPYHWLETILPANELYNNPSVKLAWENFLVVAALSNVKLNKEHL